MPLDVPSYPVNLVLTGRPCLVVGGGPVALHKARALARCLAAVTVVAPAMVAGFEELAAEGFDLRLERRRYAEGEAAAYRLVVTATGVREIDRLVHADGETAGVFVNAADDLEGCSFILPAVWRQGTVTASVSTGGASPAFAGWLRDRIASVLGPEVGELARLVGSARAGLPRASTGRERWRELFESGVEALLAEGRVAEAEAIVARFVSEEARRATHSTTGATG